MSLKFASALTDNLVLCSKINLQTNKENYFSFKAYANSKLLNVLFTRQLAKRLAGTNVSVRCL